MIHIFIDGGAVEISLDISDRSSSQDVDWAKIFPQPRAGPDEALKEGYETTVENKTPPANDDKFDEKRKN